MAQVEGNPAKRAGLRQNKKLRYLLLGAILVLIATAVSVTVIVRKSSAAAEAPPSAVSSPSTTTSSPAAATPSPTTTIGTPRLVQTLTGHTDALYDLVVAPDGRHIFTSSTDRTVKMWEVPLGSFSPIWQYDVPTRNSSTSDPAAYKNGLPTLAVTPDGRQLYARGLDGPLDVVKKWTIEKGSIVNAGNPDRLLSMPTSSAIAHLVITPDGRSLLVGNGTGIVHWDILGGSVLRTLEGLPSAVISLGVTPDSAQLFSASLNEYTVRQWRLSDGALLRNLTGHSNQVWWIVVSPDSKLVFTGSRDSTVKIWDVATGNLLKTFVPHTGWVVALALSPDGAYLFTGGYDDKTAKIWSLAG
ncbi:quinon protein alcohol dehydrogenase-like superfamily [Fimicolochytrium jonesii]|uniref:quinon protein alcohol dehydrogenase-like superfamily n=1 Tax=Fimicolochytrium jonesii TaxID=1396493 RepID=UPI0022FE70A6|nr:quinon protein alcohol dehydrogenase-like superfamily [Fimicolochytrium jonesii]KAI8818476.1 quinon protein alcohol dehydrogenase-like superfamily [Fimicolochytrium jonesii]